MKKLMTRIIDLEQSRFILVGIANTIIGTTIMFLAYNLFGFGYWISSALNYIVGSVFSYFANKYFTFKEQKKSVTEIIRFVINIAVCYVIAYGLAKRLIFLLCYNMIRKVEILEQLSMVAGMVVFVMINYMGQKYWVFHKKGMKR